MGYIAIFEKGNHGKVLEVVGTEAQSFEAMKAYKGTATRAKCSNDVMFAYSYGKDITREYEIVDFKVVGFFKSEGKLLASLN